MKFALIFLIIVSNTSFANISSVTSGDNIEASKLNELISKINELNNKVATLELNVLPVGSIVSSILTLSQYQAANGDCWKIADGSALSVSDDLRVITGMTTIPDATTEGTFLRQAKSGRVLGSYEDESFKSHTHIQDSHNHSQNAHNHTQDAHSHITSGTNVNLAQFGRGGGSFSGGTYNSVRADTGHFTSGTAATNQATTATNNATTATNQNTGGAETKPKNLAVNLFLKIKKECVIN